MTELKYTDAQIEAMVARLLTSTPNWLRESFGDWKDAVHTYDRAPKVAADMLRSILSERQAARSVVVSDEDVEGAFNGWWNKMMDVWFDFGPHEERYTDSDRQLALLAWQAALRYRDEQEKSSE